MSSPPNPRLQRTRSASPPSPLSRQPLGDRALGALFSVAFVLQAGDFSAKDARSEGLQRVAVLEDWHGELSALVKFDGSTPTSLARCPESRAGCAQLRKDLFLRVFPEKWAGMTDSDDPVGFQFDLFRDEAGKRRLVPSHEPAHGDFYLHVSSILHDLSARSRSEWGPYREIEYPGFWLTIRVLEYELVGANMPDAVRARLTLSQPLKAFKQFSALVSIKSKAARKR
jgi:hypothetical protein